MTPQALSRTEARLLPEIDAAERWALPRFTSPLVTAVAGSDARERWEKLPISATREVICMLMTVRIMLSTRGPRTFDPESVQVDWKYCSRI